MTSRGRGGGQGDPTWLEFAWSLSRRSRIGYGSSVALHGRLMTHRYWPQI